MPVQTVDHNTLEVRQAFKVGFSCALELSQSQLPARVNPLRITYGTVRTWVTGMKAHGRPLADADAKVR